MYASARYSTSIDERDTMCYFLVFYKIKELSRKMVNPIVE